MSLSMALASLRREAEVFSVSGLPSIVAKVFFVAAPVATPLGLCAVTTQAPSLRYAGISKRKAMYSRSSSLIAFLVLPNIDFLLSSRASTALFFVVSRLSGNDS